MSPAIYFDCIEILKLLENKNFNINDYNISTTYGESLEDLSFSEASKRMFTIINLKAYRYLNHAHYRDIMKEREVNFDDEWIPSFD